MSGWQGRGRRGFAQFSQIMTYSSINVALKDRRKVDF
jgi:hypothetical protein